MVSWYNVQTLWAPALRNLISNKACPILTVFNTDLNLISKHQNILLSWGKLMSYHIWALFSSDLGVTHPIYLQCRLEWLVLEETQGGRCSPP